MINGIDASMKMGQSLEDAFMIVKKMRVVKLIVSTSSRDTKRTVPVRLN